MLLQIIYVSVSDTEEEEENWVSLLIIGLDGYFYHCF